MSDIQARLREMADMRHMDRGNDAVDDIMREAADEIERLRKALEASYMAGFKASSEGWNGEHGCFDPEHDCDLIRNRDEFLRSIEAAGE